MSFKILLLSSVSVLSIAAQEPINSVKAEVNFWAGQYVEHAEFAAGFTQDPLLKNEGMELKQQVLTFKKALQNNPDFQAQFQKLSQNMKEYQDKVMAYVKKQPKSKIKDIQLDLLDHMNLETEYASKKSTGKHMSKEDEANFWNKEHEGEAKVMNALIVPTAPRLKEEAGNVAARLKKNTGWLKSSDLKTVEQANQELNAIGKELDKDPAKSEIPAKLAKHEERERMHAEEIFKQFNK